MVVFSSDGGFVDLFGAKSSNIGRNIGLVQQCFFRLDVGKSELGTTGGLFLLYKLNVVQIDSQPLDSLVKNAH